MNSKEASKLIKVKASLLLEEDEKQFAESVGTTIYSGGESSSGF